MTDDLLERLRRAMPGSVVLMNEQPFHACLFTSQEREDMNQSNRSNQCDAHGRDYDSYSKAAGAGNSSAGLANRAMPGTMPVEVKRFDVPAERFEVLLGDFSECCVRLDRVADRLGGAEAESEPGAPTQQKLVTRGVADRYSVLADEYAEHMRVLSRVLQRLERL